MLRQQQSKQHRQFASAALFLLATFFATFVLSCAQEDKPAPVPRARRAGTGTATNRGETTDRSGNGGRCYRNGKGYHRI